MSKWGTNLKPKSNVISICNSNVPVYDVILPSSKNVATSNE